MPSQNGLAKDVSSSHRHACMLTGIAVTSLIMSGEQTTKPEETIKVTAPSTPLNALTIYADLVQDQFLLNESDNNSDMEISAQELLLMLCNTEPPEVERVDTFIELLHARGIKLKLINFAGKFQLLYLLKRKDS